MFDLLKSLAFAIAPTSAACVALTIPKKSRVFTEPDPVPPLDQVRTAVR